MPALRAALDEWVIDGKPIDSELGAGDGQAASSEHRLPAAQFHERIRGYEVDFRIVGARSCSSATAGTATVAIVQQFEQRSGA